MSETHSQYPVGAHEVQRLAAGTAAGKADSLYTCHQAQFRV